MALIGLFQSALSSQIRIFNASPDVVFVVVITWVLVRDQPEGLLAALVGGAAVAALSGGPKLIIVLLYCLCSVLVGYAHRRLPRMAGIIPYLAIIVATLTYKGVLIFWMQTSQELVYIPGLLLQVVIPAVLYNLVLMAIVYQLATRLNKLLGPPTVDWQ